MDYIWFLYYLWWADVGSWPYAWTLYYNWLFPLFPKEKIGCKYPRKKPCDVSFLWGAAACFAICALWSPGANLPGSFISLQAEAQRLSSASLAVDLCRSMVWTLGFVNCPLVLCFHNCETVGFLYLKTDKQKNHLPKLKTSTQAGWCCFEKKVGSIRAKDLIPNVSQVL